MRPIYRPKGAAAEYADYAINIYTGCANGCTYCYAPRILRKSREAFARDVRVRPGLMDALDAQLSSGAFEGKTVHLCFTCDPYPAGHAARPTRDVIEVLKRAGCHVQVLTKNPTASMRDWGCLDEGDWIGTTFTGADPWDAGDPSDPSDVPYLRHEPLAENEHSRYKALKAAKGAGLRTWASCEPVIDPAAICGLVAKDGKDNPIDLFKIGKLNHARSDIDWAAFGQKVESLCRRLGRSYVIKGSLREIMGGL